MEIPRACDVGLVGNPVSRCHSQGLDLEMPMNYEVTEKSVGEALANHTLSIEQIDRAVGRLLTMEVSMGFLDHKKPGKFPLDSAEMPPLS